MYIIRIRLFEMSRLQTQKYGIIASQERYR